MRHCLGLAVTALLLAAPASAAPEDAIHIELNNADSLQSRCRMTFVVDNKGEALESLKLDLALFNREAVVQRRIVIEFAPLRRAKTVVKAFEFEGACGELGAILVNDVSACAPGEAGACLDRLTLSSKAKDIRLYK